MKSFFLISIAIIVVVGTTAVSLGFYPVLRVNGTWVDQRDVEERTRLLLQVAAQQLETSSDALTSVTDSIRRRVLDDMVTQILAREIADDVVPNITEAVADNLQAARRKGDLEQRIKEIYGLEYGTFEEVVLVPAAVIDAIRSAVGQERMEQLFEERQAQARVSVYVLPYVWNGTAIVGK